MEEVEQSVPVCPGTAPGPAGRFVLSAAIAAAGPADWLGRLRAQHERRWTAAQPQPGAAPGPAAATAAAAPARERSAGKRGRRRRGGERRQEGTKGKERKCRRKQSMSEQSAENVAPGKGAEVQFPVKMSHFWP